MLPQALDVEVEMKI